MNDLKMPEKKFRPELEGVRAVAAMLVAVYHIWLGSVSGGVDVFFIVSGYLITTSLLSRMEREGRLHFTEYLMGLAKRLFPLALTVVLVTAVGSFFLLTRAQWSQIIPQVFSSAFYFQNWQLANNAVDYLAQNNQASPFQHFWALSIQGQFYLTWPLVILLAYIAAVKWFKTPIRKTLLLLLSIIFISSLSYSIYITAENQPWAYFDTFARVWEFSLGGILALMIPYLFFHKYVSFVLGWTGLAVIALTGLLLPVSTVFPGYAALLPTTGVMLVIIAAENGSRFGVEKLLGSRPFLYFGSISYGFYLWHWPILIFYYAYFNTDTVTNVAGAGILVTAFLLSVLSIKGIEEPIRSINVKKSKKKLTVVLTGLILPVVLAGSAWGVYLDQTTDSLNGNYSVNDYPGARAVSEGIEPAPGLEPLSVMEDGASQLPAFHEDEECYTQLDERGVSFCSYGETENPDYTVALVGGSHSGHWFPALEAMSEDLNMQIDLYNKDGCRFSSDDFNGTLSDTCMEWNEEVVEPLMENPPDLLITTANVNTGSTVPDGYLGMWEKFEGVTEVFAIRDNPRMAENIPVCIEATPDDCAIPRSEALSEAPPWENTENIPDNVTFADLSEYFCTDETCEPVIGNVVVYRDQHHINTYYSMTMASALQEHIEEALEEQDQ